ncbi:hypothetical protein AYI68_g3072 [Smittium mucronatum]|uniref:Integrase zinc-binding domain-containing protein n=1 Tax=Smittium mucronatum TaxID=133383 RepID=A0A1R0H0X7_9FUNG|nr:hypothetical protein AYI68_g3072 [Smittium mucronatum]
MEHALQAYDYTIKHIKCLENGLTNVLSRKLNEKDSENNRITADQTKNQRPPRKTLRRSVKLNVLADSSSDNETSSEYPFDYNKGNDETQPTEYFPTENNGITTSSLPRLKKLIKMQQTYPKTYQIFENLNNNISIKIRFQNQPKHYKIIKKALYAISDSENPKLYVPKPLVKSVVFHHHEIFMMSHLGHPRTLDKIKQNLYWPKISRDVFGYIQTFKTFQLKKTFDTADSGELQPIIVSEPF